MNKAQDHTEWTKCIPTADQVQAKLKLNSIWVLAGLNIQKSLWFGPSHNGFRAGLRLDQTLDLSLIQIKLNLAQPMQNLSQTEYGLNQPGPRYSLTWNPYADQNALLRSHHGEVPGWAFSRPMQVPSLITMGPGWGWAWTHKIPRHQGLLSMAQLGFAGFRLGQGPAHYTLFQHIN